MQVTKDTKDYLCIQFYIFLSTMSSFRYLLLGRCATREEEKENADSIMFFMDQWDVKDAEMYFPSRDSDTYDSDTEEGTDDNDSSKQLRSTATNWSRKPRREKKATKQKRKKL